MTPDQLALYHLLGLNRPQLVAMRDLVDKLIEGWDIGIQPLTEDDKMEIVEGSVVFGEPEAG